MDDIVKEAADVILDNTLLYAEEVVLSRVFPSKSDGLKEAQRAALYTLYEESGKNNDFVKSLNVCSATVGRRHPHNDMSIYTTMVGMIGQRNSLIEPQGSIYSRVSGDKSHPRYTNMRLSKLGKELFSTLNYVEMVETFNEKFRTPKALKPRFPYMLFTDFVNIAFGTSSVSLPFNSLEILDAMSLLVENKDATTEELAEIIKGPDLGKRHNIYMSKDSLYSLIENGNGYVTIVCDTEINKKKGIVRIKELPWKETAVDLYESILEKAKNALEGHTSDAFSKSTISNINLKGLTHSSTEHDIDIIVMATDKNKVDELAEELYEKTNLKRSYNIELLFKNDDGDKISIYGIREILMDLIEFNREVVKNDFQAQINDLEVRMETSKAIELITRDDFKEVFKEAIFKPNKRQILLDAGVPDEYISVIMRTSIGKLSDRLKVIEDIESFEGQIKEIRSKINPENIDNEVKIYIEKIKGILSENKRLTQVYYINKNTYIKPKPTEEKEFSFIKVLLTEKGFVASSKDNLFNLLYKDKPKMLISCTSKDEICMVTNDFIVKVPADEIESKFKNGNTYIRSTKNLKTSSQAINCIYLVQEGSNLDYVFITNKGGIKKLRNDTIIQKNNLLNGFNFEKDETIIDVLVVDSELEPDLEFETITKFGYIKRHFLSNYTYKTRNSGFSSSTKLDFGDSVVDVRKIDPRKKDGTVKLLTDSGIVEKSYNVAAAQKSPYVKGLNLKVKNIKCFAEESSFFEVSDEFDSLREYNIDQVTDFHRAFKGMDALEKGVDSDSITVDTEVDGDVDSKSMDKDIIEIKEGGSIFDKFIPVKRFKFYFKV